MSDRRKGSPDTTLKQSKLDPNEPTRAAGPGDVTRRKFADEDNMRTTIPTGRPLNMTQREPSGSIKTGAVKQREPSGQFKREQPEPASSALTTLPPVVDALAAAEVPTGEHQRAKVWVATHKPPEDPDPRLILLREPDSPRSASFRVLRHRLQEHGDPRVIAVSSARAREGKTTCAANLAMALGECGRARVLLVEANLRSPALAALFGFLPPECFSVQLRRHRERPADPWSVVEVYSPSLHVAAVKPGPDSENRPLLDSVAFGQAIEVLRGSGYEYVVIDTPPVLGAADVNLIQDSSDGVLLTAWSRQSSGRDLRDAVEQLAPAKLLGVTLLDA